MNSVLCLFDGLSNAFSNVLSPRKWKKKQDRFPLLHIGYVPIREVLNFLDPIDYINFSKASKACRTLAATKKPYKVTVTIRHFTVFRMGYGPVSYAFRWNKGRWRNGTRRIRKWKNPTERREYYLIHSENPFDSLKEFYLYARNLMGIDIDWMVIFMDDFKGSLRQLIDWLRSTSREFPVLSVHGKYRRQNELQYILDNVKFKDCLDLDVRTIERRPLEIPGTIERLHIIHAPWITLNYVMSLKLSKFSFLGTYLTNQQINFFYKSWIKMESHQNLKSFGINLTNPESFISIGLRDIPHKMGRMRPGPFLEYHPWYGSFEITRNDGLTASICIYIFRNQLVAVMYTQLALPKNKSIHDVSHLYCHP